MTIQTDREATSPRVDEIIRHYLTYINSRPELLSLLYDINMMPEQTTSEMGAIRLAAFCEVWKRMADARALLGK